MNYQVSEAYSGAGAKIGGASMKNGSFYQNKYMSNQAQQQNN
jgi:hypothetical protein